MIQRVRDWIGNGIEVRIFTARICNDPDGTIANHIKHWCVKHIGWSLQVTNKKDYNMLELWDDRVVQVIKDTGERVGNYERN